LNYVIVVTDAAIAAVVAAAVFVLVCYDRVTKLYIHVVAIAYKL